MRYPRWFRLLLAALTLQLSTVDPLWAQGEVSFIRQDFGVGLMSLQQSPATVTVGDFNGDSQQDLATANFVGGGGTVSILLGRGDGTFEPAQDFQVVDDFQDAPFSVTVGDFNGDGRQDLAAPINCFPPPCRDFVSILLGNGDGTFERAQNVGVRPCPLLSVAVGDFNGDSRQDLATVTLLHFGTACCSVSILLGRGDGTFESAQRVGAGVNEGTINVGDFNGDSQQDLAAGNTVFLGNGDGTFERGQALETELALSVTVGDFNGDGRQDLATANLFANSVSILLGNGDGTFQAARDISVPGGPEWIAVGDFDGDSEQDLATGNRRGTVSLLLGRGDGTFEVAQDIEVGLGPSVTVGDFNGDSRQDLATANRHSGTVSILINIASVEVTTYRLTRIGDDVTCGGSSCFPTITDMNDGAEMVGTTKSLGGEPPRAILLRGGIVNELGDLLGGRAPNAGATAIGGGITGTNQIQDASGNLVTRGVLWQGLQIQDLGVDGDATPLDINLFGQIVGQVVAGNVGRPFLWEIVEGVERTTLLETLFCPGNLGGSARAINDSGIIVGSSNSTVGRRAVIWQAGGVGITPLEPPFVLEVGEAVDVNDRGDVIGFYFNSSGPQMDTVLLWQADEVTVLLPLDRADANGARPESINNRGQIVGSTHLSSGQTLATLWQDGGAALDLNELVSDDDPAKAFVTLITAIVINDFGLIVALGEDSRVPVGQEGREAQYLLKPTGIPPSSAATPSPSASPPSPSDNGGGAIDRVSLLLLIIIVSASAAYVRRRQRAVLVARPFD